MPERETIVPLTLGAVVAMLAHLLLAPLAGLLMRGDDAASRWPALEAAARPLLEPPPPTELGVEASTVSSVAWIPYEAYEELVAPRSKLLQPAVQQEVDPVVGAPIEANPTPPAPRAPDEAEAASPVSPSPEPREPGGSPPLLPPILAEADPPPIGDIRSGPPVPESPMPPQPRDEPVPAPSPEVMPYPSPPPSRSAGGRPTSAPRSDRDADPVMITDAPVDVRPGQVLARPGLEIKTARPRFSVTTALTAIPRNPTVRITFAPDGSVIDASIKQSTGYNDVDGPILTSLYRWRASGRQLAEIGRPVTGEWRILLMDE